MDSVAPQQLKLMPKKRMAGDIDQRFRQVLRQRPQSCGVTTRQYECGHKFCGIAHRVAPSIVRNDSGAFKVESETHLLQPLLSQSTAKTRFVFCIEHEKSATARADEFAATGSVCERALI